MKKIVSILSAAIVIISCNQDFSVSKENSMSSPGIKGTQETKSNLIKFKVNGKPVVTSGWTISRFTLGDNSPGEWLNITSNMHDEKRAINVNLNGSRPGEYIFDATGNIQMQSHGSYFPDYTGDMSNSFSFIKGSFRITEADTVKRIINGTFAGTVENARGEILEITDGEIINGSLQSNIMIY